MSGIGSIMLSGLTALRASQEGLGVASQNISNANTPGYVRTEITLSPRATMGPGGGVEVSGVRRAADQFLATASFIAEATRGASAARADILSRAQASFGDPNNASSMFATLDEFWAAISELQVDPSSTLRRDDVVSALQTAYGEIGRVGNELQTLAAEADQRIGEAVAEAQSLINRIASLNTEIQLTQHSGADASAAENAQSALIDQLSSLMDIRITPVSEGGVHVRTSGGALLVGASAAQISYTPSASPFSSHGVIQLNPQLQTASNLEPFISGGTIEGLLRARDVDLPALAEALGGLAGSLADGLNQVHNENASSPPVGELVGRQTGLLATDALNFTGQAVIGLTDGAGNLLDRLTIDFDAVPPTISTTTAGTFNVTTAEIGNAATAGTFVAQLNAALQAISAGASANFSNGVLTLDSGGGGIVVQQDGADPSGRAGRGFSHFFGLNDIVSRPTPLFFESGVSASDDHGFGATESISFSITDSAGRVVGTRTVSMASVGGTDFTALLAALNANTTGIGGYGSLTLDSSTGRVSLSSNTGYQVTITSDSTNRGGTGVSFSALNGLTSAATAGRAVETQVNSLLADDPGRLGVARPDLSVAIGQPLVEGGDNRGASALQGARDTIRSFASAGVLGAQSTSLGLYISRLAGEVGRLASDAQRASVGAEAVATAAADRRAQVEGVNIDDELVRMTAFQNAYAAAARVIQAASEMYDILLTLGARG